jgi:hypothetical protein
MASQENICDEISDKIHKDLITDNKTHDETYDLDNKLNECRLSNYEFNLFKSKSVISIICCNSPFRKIKFKFNDNPIIEYPLLIKNAGRIITFSNLSKLILSYIIRHKLFFGNGIIICDPFLKMATDRDSINFFDLMKLFRKIII